MGKPSPDPIHAVFEQVTDGYVALDREWRFVYVNAGAGRLLDRAPERLIGRILWNEFPESAALPFGHACRRAMETQEPVFIEEFYPPFQRWFENRLYPSPQGLAIFFRDVSRRKEIERKLQQQQRMLDEAQRVARVGSWEWRVGAERVCWSAELFRIYGLPPHEEGPTFDEFLARVHPDDRGVIRAAIERVLAGRQPVEFEERICLPDGRQRVLSSRAEVVLDTEGRPERLIGACQDVTERKRDELFDSGQREILAAIAADRPIEESLSRIARLHEALNPGALCSILLLDGDRVRHGAAPNLPPEYNQAIDGIRIGDGHGSCGTAAFRAERVIVEDIATHPYWEAYRPLALRFGLRACWSAPVFGSTGQVLGTFAVYYREPRTPDAAEIAGVDRMLPITSIALENHRRGERLRERDRFFELALEIFCIFDPTSERLVQVNGSFERVTGHSAETLTGRRYLEFVHPDDRAAVAAQVQILGSAGGRISQFAFRFLCADGSYRWLEWEAVQGPEGHTFAVARDVTEQRRIQSELEYAESHDPVTGLEHHRVLERRLAALLDDAAVPVWILFIGLDRFRLVNESMGHATGDDVLVRVAARLRDTVGHAGHVARFAGDEFVAAIPGLERDQALALAEALRATVARPIEGGDYRLVLSASVGMVQSPTHGRSLQELLRRAEAAMVRAKRQGHDGVCEFSAAQMRDVEDRIVLGRALRGAAQRGEMSLHYQPQQHAADRTLTGFEALLRWHSPLLGHVPPNRFIPIAEALGLMPEIGDWVVNEACRQARTWLDAGHSDFTIAVNVSALQLQRPGLVEQVRAALDRHALPPAVLDVELTESSLMENIERVRDTLHELRQLGVRLSLDDFGTGYSSLAYLKQLPLHTLKIDRSFVQGLPDDPQDAAIARTIVAMAHQLGLVVAAEGVETGEQAAFLAAIGCDELQGYHLGRPVAPGEAATWFER